MPNHASTSATKPNIHGLKCLLCIWWDQLGIVSCSNRPKPLWKITTNDVFEPSIEKKKPLYEQRHNKVISQHDNMQPHVVKQVKTNLELLKWEIILPLPYSPNIASSNNHLFQSIAHSLAEQHFHSHKDKKNRFTSG